MKKLSIILILSLAVQLCFGQNECNDSIIDFSEIPPPPPPPPPKKHLFLLNTIVRFNNISKEDLDKLEKVIVLKDTNVLDTLNFSESHEQLNFLYLWRNKMDTVKNGNEIYYFRTNLLGRRDTVKIETYNSQNLLVKYDEVEYGWYGGGITLLDYNENGMLLSKSVYYRDDRAGLVLVIGFKILYDYNDNGELFSETTYKFSIDLQDTILEKEIFYKYENGKLIEQNRIEYLFGFVNIPASDKIDGLVFYTSAKDVRTNYYDMLGKIIKTERMTIGDGDTLWREISEFRYNKENKLEVYVRHYSGSDSNSQEKIIFEYIENRIITYRIIDTIKEKYYEYILE